MFLVVQTAFLGDMILTTPLLEQLSARGPVDVVATPASASLLVNHPAVRDVIVFDKRGAHRGLRGLRKVADAVRWRLVNGVREPRGAAVALMAQGSARSAALARLGGVPRIVGFDTSGGRWLYTQRVPFDASRHHVVRLLMLDVDTPAPDSAPRPSLYPGVAEREAVDQLLAAAGVGASEPLVVFAPGSVWATKRWPGFDALAGQLANNAPTRIVIVGSANDAEHVARIAGALPTDAAPLVDATGRLSLLATAALMSKAHVVVSNDSAPLHLASAMNTPTVALFGPTVPAFGYGPLASRRAVVQHEALACRPCHPHGPPACPLGHWRCMREIDAGRVHAAITQVVA